MVSGQALRLTLAVNCEAGRKWSKGNLSRLAGGSSSGFHLDRNDTGRNKVYVLRDFAGKRIRIRSEVLAPGFLVLIKVVVGLENVLELANRSLKVQPAFALGRRDLVFRDSSLNQPSLDSFNRFRGRREEVNDLVLGVMTSVVFRRWIRTVNLLTARSVDTSSAKTYTSMRYSMPLSRFRCFKAIRTGTNVSAAARFVTRLVTASKSRFS